MQKGVFMQLLILLALLLYGGNAQNILSEVKPVIESFGGEEMKEALKSADELSGVLSAVKEISEIIPQPTRQAQSNVSFPLAPISNIADKEITYSLSKYIGA